MTLKDTVPGHVAAAPETSALPGKRVTVLDAKARELLSKVAENLEGAVEFLPVSSRKYFSGLAIEVRDLANPVKEEILMSLEEARFEALLEERVRVRTREKIASWFGLEMLSMSESDVALEVYAKRLQQIAQDAAQFSENWKAVVEAVNPDDPTIESVLKNVEAMKNGVKENFNKTAPQNNSEHLQIDPISEICSSCGEKMIATLMRSEPKIVCDKGCRNSVWSTFEPPCPSCKKNGKNGKLKFRSPSIGDMFLCDKCNFCLKSKRLFEQANRNKEQVDGMSQESILMAWVIEGKSSRCSAPNMSMKKFLKEDHENWSKNHSGRTIFQFSENLGTLNFSEDGVTWMKENQDKIRNLNFKSYEDLFFDPRFEERTSTVLLQDGTSIDLQDAMVDCVINYKILTSVGSEQMDENIWEAQAISKSNRMTYSASGRSRVDVLYKLFRKLLEGSLFREEHARLGSLARLCNIEVND